MLFLVYIIEKILSIVFYLTLVAIHMLDEISVTVWDVIFNTRQ